MEEVVLNNCCGDSSSDYVRENPKNRPSQRRLRQLWFIDPPNPVPAQIEDTGDLQKLFSVWYKDVLVPYAGRDDQTAHALQSFLMTLKDLSPTKAGVIRNQKVHCFGGKVEIIRSFDPDFELDEPPAVSLSEKQRFYDFLQQIPIYGADEQRISFRKLAQFQFDDMKGSGDVWFELVRSQTAGQRFFHVHTHKPTHCIYLATKAGQQRYVAVSPVWTYHFVTQYPPRILPLYPLWQTDETGVERTIVHVKSGNYPWYGRPDDMGSMLDQFFEFQNSDYKNKQTASQFLGQAFIEIEDENPEYTVGDGSAQSDGFNSLAQQFEENHTNRSARPQTVVLTTRPYGSKEAFVFQFTPNTNEAWFEKTEAIAEANIIKANSWSRRLMDLDVSNGFSTEIYMDIFKIFSATVISDLRQQISEPINNIIIGEAANWLNAPDMLQYSIEFTSPFKRMLEEAEQNRNNGQDANNARGDTDGIAGE